MRFFEMAMLQSAVESEKEERYRKLKRELEKLRILYFTEKNVNKQIEYNERIRTLENEISEIENGKPEKIYRTFQI